MNNFASDIGVDDLVDFDNFLDSYLVHLQSGRSSQPVGNAPQWPSQAYGTQPAPQMQHFGLGERPMYFPQQAAQSPAMPNFNQQLFNQTVGFHQPYEHQPPQVHMPEVASKGLPATRKGKNTSRHHKNAEPELSASDGDSASGHSDGSSADEHKSRKRRELTTEEMERRQNALQEKNRRAQRRFRERQKNKLQELHKQIEELTTKVGTLQSENASLHSRTNILEKVLDMRNEQIQVMQETKEGPFEEDNLSAVGVSGQTMQLTPEMVKSLSSEQIYRVYQAFVKELSAKLLAAQNSPGMDSVLQEVDQLVKDLCVLLMRLGIVKPLETRRFVLSSRQALGNTEEEVTNMWKGVLREVKLTEAQQRDVIELKRSFLRKVEPVMDERRALNLQIQANLPQDTVHTKNALTYIHAHEAVMKLRDNLRAEQHILLEFSISVFRGIFRPLQMAATLVKSYPAVPDALGVASAIAHELGVSDSPDLHLLSRTLQGFVSTYTGPPQQPLLTGGHAPALPSSSIPGPLPPTASAPLSAVGRSPPATYPLASLSMPNLAMNPPTTSAAPPTLSSTATAMRFGQQQSQQWGGISAAAGGSGSSSSSSHLEHMNSMDKLLGGSIMSSVVRESLTKRSSNASLTSSMESILGNAAMLAGPQVPSRTSSMYVPTVMELQSLCRDGIPTPDPALGSVQNT